MSSLKLVLEVPRLVCMPRSSSSTKTKTEAETEIN
ncbi:hypothetical protein FPSE_10417 [Fusarium pseudograminearum CS3096]|uniref:Uncharacterized protein n=1 Tax=Fusarium pseudograminearum (strain CS3096) TaxID=1028729 RepID=K3V7G7_FUSPC|nr:hypothetical protein FPSE_10417 [Fusarium pseudograminearum CS3096]EKJ69427.1 hypothetical protein FPSE_10417 [Fusarium pseudograminearum CS3096]